MGENVRISTVAVAQGNLTVRVVETPQVSQPQPFSNGSTVVVPRTDVQVQEGNGRQFVTVGGNVSLQQLVNGLNALGVGPRDMVAIQKDADAAAAQWHIVDAYLTTRRCITGDGFTLADIALGTFARRWFGVEGITKPPFPHLERWFAELAGRPAFVQHIAPPMS